MNSTVYLIFKGLKKTEKNIREHKVTVSLDEDFKLNNETLDELELNCLNWVKLHYTEVDGVRIMAEKGLEEKIGSFTFFSTRRVTDYWSGGTLEVEELFTVKNIVVDKTRERIRINFPYKPNEETRNLIKNIGFSWARTQCRWVRPINTDEKFLTILKVTLERSNAE